MLDVKNMNVRQTMSQSQDLSHIRAVLFDLDGTLVDTSGDLRAALNYVLQKINRPIMDESHVRHLTGHGAKALLERGLRDSGGLPEDIHMDELLNDFLSYYRNNLTVHSHFFPGAEAALKQLQDHGIALAVCTNKPHQLALQLLSELAGTDYFQTIKGREAVSIPKPDKAHLLEALAALQCNPDDTVMIGDSYNDIEAARRARIASIAVDFGYSNVPVSTLKPDAIISSYNDLTPCLATISASHQLHKL
ncbi:MAG: phosphoglycolate phosphatase [Kordiimonas sp.]|nr:phosphoglycolate phosphatase [Kordiimonas sp.]|tara:strand:+ start:1887 stop:2633 length:747 start_codon:yes stop_codon:yes gene_type:complete